MRASASVASSTGTARAVAKKKRAVMNVVFILNLARKAKKVYQHASPELIQIFGLTNLGVDSEVKVYCLCDCSLRDDY